MQKERYKFIQQSKCFAIVCSHTDNVLKFVDTLHKFIKSSNSQSITPASQAVAQSQNISIYLQLITNKIIHNIIQSNMILQITIQISCKTHKWRTLEKSRQHCALPLGPLSRLLATFSHLAVPNHDKMAQKTAVGRSVTELIF